MAIINGTFLPDILIGTSEDDTINGFGGLDTISGGDGNDVLDGGVGDDVLIGGDGNDILIGGPGAATLLSLYNGGNGNDLMIASDLGVAEDFDGGDGIDTVSFAARDQGVTTFLSVLGIPLLDTLRNVENVIGSSFDDEITGDGGNNTLDGSDGNDVLDGGGGNDVLIGGIGADAMTGGTGDDIYYIDNAGDTVTEFDGGGNDTVRVSTSYTLTEGSSVENVEHVDPSGNDDFDLTGHSGGNNLTGNNGANTIDGGGGADTMNGLGGDDTYYVDHEDDVVVEAPGAGNDRVIASTDWTLDEGVSVESLEAASGTDPVGLTGNSEANAITGNDGANILNGGGGADTMTGHAGDDTYYVDNAGDSVVEVAGEGNDRIIASFSYTLGAGGSVEGLEAAAGVDPINLTGNADSNALTGNDGANIIDGAGGADNMAGNDGDDTYYVDHAEDVVIEGLNNGNDRVVASTSWVLGANPDRWVETLEAASGSAAINLTGNGANQTLIGNAGNNVLHGGGGTDELIGHGGNDVYYTDVASTTIVEQVGEGNDALYTSVSYQLASGVEVEYLSVNSHASTAALNLTGNGFNQTLVGNNGANILHGGGGTDVLSGLGGNDIYYTDVATTQVLEAVGGGTDALYTSVSYQLAGGVSVETLSTNSHAATSAINLTGNSYNQTLVGNAGNNILHGGGGTDLLIGLGGDDVYYTDFASTTVYEVSGGGNDQLYTSVSYVLGAGVHVEYLSVNSTAATTAINLTGNVVAQTLFGNSGANVLNGGQGSDTLIGWFGADTFVFDTSLGASNVDTILDFRSIDDTIALDDAVFAGVGSPGSFNANAFVTGTAALDANDRIVYNQATGQLFYDADGNGAGAAVLFATIANHSVVTASDFQVI